MKINTMDKLRLCHMFFTSKVNRNHTHTHALQNCLLFWLSIVLNTGSAVSTVKKLTSCVVRSDPCALTTGCNDPVLQGVVRLPPTTAVTGLKTPRMNQKHHKYKNTIKEALFLTGKAIVVQLSWNRFCSEWSNLPKAAPSSSGSASSSAPACTPWCWPGHLASFLPSVSASPAHPCSANRCRGHQIMKVKEGMRFVPSIHHIHSVYSQCTTGAGGANPALQYQRLEGANIPLFMLFITNTLSAFASRWHSLYVGRVYYPGVHFWKQWMGMGRALTLADSWAIMFHLFISWWWLQFQLGLYCEGNWKAEEMVSRNVPQQQEESSMGCREARAASCLWAGSQQIH